MVVQEIKNRVCQSIDAHVEQIVNVVREIEKQPELGYKETKTAAAVAKFLSDLGYTCREGLAITGVKTSLKPGSAGPNVAILGELDAVVCPDSPAADPLTGAAHACGHNLQIGAMIGAALGLKLAGVADELGGNVSFMAVPAEEYVEIAFRQQLREQGKIRYLGGKQELIYRGEFDDVDIAMMVHSDKDLPGPSVNLPESSNGFVGMTIQYLGKEAHAAGAPDQGINALNAAMIGLMGVHALRETFRDQDIVRVHPIITKGGDLVNIVPADVRMETYVRAKTMTAIDATYGKVTRALKAGGDSVGAETYINTIPGYLPLACCPQLNELFAANAGQLTPDGQITVSGHFGGSTDMGDISHIIPSLHPFTGGIYGNHHTKEFKAADYIAACIIPAKLLAMTVIDLLAEQAAKANEIKTTHKPLLSKAEYLALLDKYFS
ncbi:amidohydrolase [Anaerosporomusa subterranea]|uniref:Peptidase M20 domain-containing protein 2 n=1 Tax=Anaerosporomusa subterranea TaxID=1794912 RepID=A0A154BU64_ANASB|nr:amidohydrolase [Anaerosporomusa subterranea]KYZ77437.1 amidohydrolase [Anaerosporomusa subterranea]